MHGQMYRMVTASEKAEMNRWLRGVAALQVVFVIALVAIVAAASWQRAGGAQTAQVQPQLQSAIR